MLVRTSAAALLAFCACSTAPEGPSTDPNGSDTTTDPGSTTGTTVPLQCDDVEQLIGLHAQVVANANAIAGAHPIVLAHGFAGFDQLGPLDYFGKAPDALRQAGYAVYVTAVTPMGSTETVRGPELGHELQCISGASGAKQLDLVGHSQGGMDVRWVAAQKAFGQYVASVTTVSTPHRGVVVADMASGLVPGFSNSVLDAIAGLYGTVVGGPNDQSSSMMAALDEMSTASMTDFNAKYPDVPGLPYFSWAGRTTDSVTDQDHEDAACAGALANPQANDLVGAELSLTYEINGGEATPNDGLVSVASAKWGTFMGCVPADHLDEVGMFFQSGADAYSGFDHVTLFTQIAQNLVDHGL